ncbi:MAG: DUF2147 domain-containing protein [Bacteroidia bacterium]|nr:DUF2147 domain-containing protein [Bacteroidia bacterium]
MKLISRLFLTFFFLFTFSLSQAQPDITGKWVAPGEKGSGIVEVFIGNDGKYHGRFVNASDPDQDRQIREKMAKDGLVQILILENLEYKGNNSWSGGTVFSVSRGTKFDCKLQLKDSKHLKVTGYFGVSWLSKSFTWYREE